MEVEIRQYQKEDVNAVLRAWDAASVQAHQFLGDKFQTQVRKDIETLYLPNADTWVALVNSDVVGFISLIGNEVGGIFLHPEYQGKKIGRLMMDKAKELHGTIKVEVFEKNFIGREFYKKYGFQIVKEYLHEPTNENILCLFFGSQV